MYIPKAYSQYPPGPPPSLQSEEPAAPSQISISLLPCLLSLHPPFTLRAKMSFAMSKSNGTTHRFQWPPFILERNLNSWLWVTSSGWDRLFLTRSPGSTWFLFLECSRVLGTAHSLSQFIPGCSRVTASECLPQIPFMKGWVLSPSLYPHYSAFPIAPSSEITPFMYLFTFPLECKHHGGEGSVSFLSTTSPDLLAKSWDSTRNLFNE